MIDQFLWQSTNLRSDQYGGAAENRYRFAIEVVIAIRDAVGPDFTICFRWSQWKIQNLSARVFQSPEELAPFLQAVSEAGVDIFHTSTRRFWEPGFEGSEHVTLGRHHQTNQSRSSDRLSKSKNAQLKLASYRE